MANIKRENKLIKMAVITATIIAVLFILKGPFVNSLKLFDGLVNSMNNKLVNVRSTIYKKELEFIFEKLNLDKKIRSEKLGIDEIIKLYKELF